MKIVWDKLTTYSKLCIEITRCFTQTYVCLVKKEFVYGMNNRFKYIIRIKDDRFGY